MIESKYWISIDGNNLGPYTAEEVRQKGGPQTLVSHGDQWLPMFQHPDFGEAQPPLRQMHAKIASRSSMAGAGCLLQGLGIASIILAVFTFATIVGPVILIPLGLWLLIYGGRKASWLECSACGTRLSNRRLQVCPSCHAQFK